MDYKNIDINALGLRQRIDVKAKRVAFFVPRLLSKLAAKVLLNPIAQATVGMSHEDIKNVAVNVVSQVQAAQADSMQEQIDAGKRNLEDWENDKAYLLSNSEEYKIYKNYIGGLEKKQARLISAPRRLLVAKTYLDVMKSFRKQKREEKMAQEMIKASIEEYQQKKDAITAKQQEIETLRNALVKAQRDLPFLTQELEEFRTKNPELVSQIDAQEKAKVEQAPSAPVLEQVNVEVPGNMQEKFAEYGLNPEPGRTM